MDHGYGRSHRGSLKLPSDRAPGVDGSVYVEGSGHCGGVMADSSMLHKEWDNAYGGADQVFTHCGIAKESWKFESPTYMFCGSEEGL